MSEQEKTWKCPLCGSATNTGKYCESCGALRFEGMAEESAPEVTPTPVPLTTGEPQPAADAQVPAQETSAPSENAGATPAETAASEAGTTPAETAAVGAATAAAASMPPQPQPAAGAPVYTAANVNVPQYANTPVPVTPQPQYQYGPAGGAGAARGSGAQSSQDNTPTILCVISLVLYFVAPTILGVIYSMFNSIPGIDDLDLLTGTLSIIACIAPIAAIVLMIVVRVKYPKNTFGKVLMWIYIILLILEVISVVILIFACAALVNSCRF